MKRIYNEIFSEINTEELLRNTRRLYELELGQTFSCYHASAAETVQILRETGIPNVEILSFPADGKTAFQDKISPLGWEASTGKLTVLSGYGIKSGFVAADYEKHPFHLIKGSVGTCPGGEYVRIISAEQLLSGTDPADALVLLPQGEGPIMNSLPWMLDLGVRGFVSDYAMNEEAAPDGIQWCNAFTERNNWHVNSDDRPFIAFSVTPETGKKLRRAAARGEVLAKIESDARLFETTIDVVTALIPGRRKEEFWIIAHLYEPLANDNSTGVAAAIETARILMQKENREFSLRLIFGMEYYGFAAYAASRGEKLSSYVIGACNYDALYVRNDWNISFRGAAPGSPFYGNYMADILIDSLQTEPTLPVVSYQNSYECMYDDDCALSDSTVGVPTVWPVRTGTSFWHNSKQTFDYIHPEAFRAGTALNASFVSSVIAPQKSFIEQIPNAAKRQLSEELAHTVGSRKEHLTRRYEILLQDLEHLKIVFPEREIEVLKNGIRNEFQSLSAGLSDEIPVSKWRSYAESLIPARILCGFPHDLAEVPVEKRVLLPGSVLYGPLAPVLANMDGARNLAEIIRSVEHEIRRLLTEPEIRSVIRAVLYLSRWNYLTLQGEKKFSKEDVVRALRQCGVQNGDFLLVHSSLSSIGEFQNDEMTVIEGLEEAVGKEGTVLFPSFTYPFVFIGEANRINWYRPFDPADMKQIWTGRLAKAVIRRKPDSVRSRHITHSWCGFGKWAEAACSSHEPCDPPVGDKSPLASALKHHGKIIHFGSGVHSTTYLHVFEDRFDLPGVETSLCKIRNEDGSCETVSVPRNFPGDRDFYYGDEESIKFFVKAKEQGLQIRKTELGGGTIRCIDIDELDRIGNELVKADPYIMLSDSEQNLSCMRLKKNKERK